MYNLGGYALKIAVVANFDRSDCFDDIKKITRLLSDSAEVLTNSSCGGFEGVTNLSEEELYRQCDMVLSLGGDGTLLSVAGKASLYDKPVLGINAGRLGFLTGGEREFFFSEGYKKITEGFETEIRMMLKAEVISDKTVNEYHALNDIVVARTSFARVGSISVFVDNELLATYPADGVIVATPTGSTAYSLSAGGPVIDPALEAIIITPICPHMLSARTIVVPPGKVISVIKTEGYNDECAMTSDGKNGCMLNDGDAVRISRSERSVKLVKISDRTFYKLLKDKLQY